MRNLPSAISSLFSSVGCSSATPGPVCDDAARVGCPCGPEAGVAGVCTFESFYPLAGSGGTWTENRGAGNACEDGGPRDAGSAEDAGDVDAG